MKKICSRCGVEQDLEKDFGKDSATKDGHRCYCKSCGKDYWRIYNETNRDKRNESARIRAAANRPKMREANRKCHFKKSYGMSLDQLESLRITQGNKCLLCLNEFEPGWGKSGPAVDHCHATGKVRGLLCSLCNTALGKFKDSQEVLARAIEYLQKNS